MSKLPAFHVKLGDTSALQTEKNYFSLCRAFGLH